MKILVLVISSRGQHYDEFRYNWLQYINCHPSFDCYLLECDPNLSTEIFVDNHIFKCRDQEVGVPGCQIKTTKSLRHFDLSVYDFVVRTNLSSAVNFDQLYQHLLTCPQTLFYSGVLIKYRWKEDIYNCASGAMYILSMDLAQVVADIHLEDYVRLNWEHRMLGTECFDDVYVGMVIFLYSQLIKQHIDVVPLPRVDYNPGQLMNVESEKNFHYRFRNDAVRHLDTINHGVICRKINNVKYDREFELRLLGRIFDAYYRSSNVFDQALTKYGIICKKILLYGQIPESMLWSIIKGLFLSDITQDHSLQLMDTHYREFQHRVEFAVQVLGLEHYNYIVSDKSIDNIDDTEQKVVGASASSPTDDTSTYDLIINWYGTHCPHLKCKCYISSTPLLSSITSVDESKTLKISESIIRQKTLERMFVYH